MMMMMTSKKSRHDFFFSDGDTKKRRVFLRRSPLRTLSSFLRVSAHFKRITHKYADALVSSTYRILLPFFSYFLCFVRGSFVAVATSVASLREDEDPFANFIFSEIVLAD